MMTVMLIRRHQGRSTTTTNYQQHQCTTIRGSAAYQLHRRHQINTATVTASATNLFRSDSNASSSRQKRCRRQQIVHQTSSSADCVRYYPGAKSLKAAFRMTYYTPARAMRYYRMWIYTCNVVLFVCVIGFIIVACKIIVADPRRNLVPEFTLTHPSLLYAYFALIVQSGFLQMIGCIGARTLNERLLNLYWLLLFLLLVGDILLGIFWYYHYEHIASQIKPILKERFYREYGADERFTDLWNMVQKEDQCCGVENYEDFYMNNSVSWAGISTMDDGMTSLPTVYLPTSCCGGFFEYLTTSTLKPPEARRNTVFSTSTTTTVPPLPPIFSTDESITVTDHVMANGIIVRCNEETALFYTAGCEKRLLNWFRYSLDVMFVLGYCVISFIKLCFVGILRYEIREMIQKIKILQAELKNTAETQDSISVGLQKLQQIRRYDHNGSVVGVAQPFLDNAREGDSRGGSMLTINGEMENNEDNDEASANSPLLKAQSIAAADRNYESKYNKSSTTTIGEDKDSKKRFREDTTMRLNLFSRKQHLSTTVFNQDTTGNDSDTNSRCALLMSDEKISSDKIQKNPSSTVNENPYNNNNNFNRNNFHSNLNNYHADDDVNSMDDVNTKYESHELQQLDQLRMSKNRAKT